MTVATSPYLSMIAKKRAWQATPVDNAPVKEGAEDTLFRALASASFGATSEGLA
jgi:hypothetical protein